MRNAAGEEQPVPLKQTIVVNDPSAMRAAALLRLGVTMIVKADALPHLKPGELVRLLWWVDAGPISLYYASKSLIPSKTRVFIDFIVDVFQRERYPNRFAGGLG
jgi:DNA-binding transcriptional LysR family regulator